MPLASHNRDVACLDLVPHLTRLPVPEAHESAAVATRDDLAVGADGDVDGIAGVVVTAKAFLSVLAEPVCRCVYDDLVVAALEGSVFA